MHVNLLAHPIQAPAHDIRSVSLGRIHLTHIAICAPLQLRKSERLRRENRLYQQQQQQQRACSINNNNNNNEHALALRSTDNEPNTGSNALTETHSNDHERECDIAHNTQMDVGSYSDCDPFSISARPSRSPTGVSPSVSFEAEIANTLKYVRFFADNSKDKHVVPIDVPLLTGKANYQEWAVKMECLLKLHQVWCTVNSSVEPLYPGHDHYIWYQHMEAVAVSCILAHVARVVYEDMALFESQRHPVKLWYALWLQYGR